jgi:septum formation initiator
VARTRHRSRHLPRWLAVAAVAFLAFFYYRPLHAYFDTRHALQERRADVRGLQAQKRRLQQQLAASTSPAALDLEARQLALVKPGERLFIVKGIAAWQRKHGGSIRRGG